MTRRRTSPWIAVALLLTLAARCAAQSTQPDAREVWEYRGGYGLSWFVREGPQKWVIYRGDGRTFLYVEERRSPEFIELRGPYTGLLIRLSDTQFESRRSADQPWRRSAGGSWVSRERVPQHIREAPRDDRIRLVYFVPADRQPAAEYEPRIRQVMSLVAELLHQDLLSKGYQPKPLAFETYDGDMLIHLVRGKQPAAFYTQDAWPEMSAQAKRIHDELLPIVGDPARQLTIVFAETYSEEPADEAWAGHIAIGSGKPPEGGFAVYSAWVLKDLFSATTREQQLRLFFDDTPIAGRKAFGSRQMNSPRYEFVEDAFGAVIHELGHALGCPHDYRDPRYIMGSGFRRLRENLDSRTRPEQRVQFSDDNARWLMCSRYLAGDLQRDDFDPPRVTFSIQRRGDQLSAVIRAEDDGQLRALLLRTSSGRSSTVVGGCVLRGQQQTWIEPLAPQIAAAGGELQMEVFVADARGNVTRVMARAAQ